MKVTSIYPEIVDNGTSTNVGIQREYSLVETFDYFNL